MLHRFGRRLVALAGRATKGLGTVSATRTKPRVRPDIASLGAEKEALSESHAGLSCKTGRLSALQQTVAFCLLAFTRCTARLLTPLSCRMRLQIFDLLCTGCSRSTARTRSYQVSLLKDSNTHHVR